MLALSGNHDVDNMSDYCLVRAIWHRSHLHRISDGNFCLL